MLHKAERTKTGRFRPFFVVGSAIVLMAAIGAMVLPAGSAIAISWQALDNCRPALALQRTSHATAGAWMVDRYGLRKSNENNKKLIAACWVYMQHCACAEEGDPMLWQIAEGLAKLCTARGYPNTPIKERCRYSNQSSETAGWTDYVAAIKDNRPVILTFCYDPATRVDLAQAKRRVDKCFSVVGIGCMNYAGQKLLICHDGLTSEQSYPVEVDRVLASDLGINIQGKPWGQPGTSLYEWDGSYSNLVMVFVGKPAR